MFRYINISVFALAVAGVASAGAIDPAVSTDYSSPDGALYSSAALPSSTWSFAGGFGGQLGQAVQPNTSSFQLSNVTVQNSSTANNGTACPYSNIFQSGGAPTCDISSVSDFLFTPSGVGGSTYVLDFKLTNAATIYGFNIFLAEAANFSSFGIQNVSFYDGTAIPANLVSSQAVNTNYSTYPGASNKLEITDGFSQGLFIPAGGEVAFTFTDGSTDTVGPRIWSIQSIDSAPEPGTWMLAGFGMLGLIAATKMKNRRVQSKL